MNWAQSWTIVSWQRKAWVAFIAKDTAISRKVVGKSARDNPEWYCGWFLIHCFSKKFQTMAREAMDVCLRVLKESNKSRFDSYSVRKSVLIISHITFPDCRVHSFSDNLSRNSCMQCVTHRQSLTRDARDGNRGWWEGRRGEDSLLRFPPSHHTLRATRRDCYRSDAVFSHFCK